jgi:hypothetical protein
MQPQEAANVPVAQPGEDAASWSGLRPPEGVESINKILMSLCVRASFLPGRRWLWYLPAPRLGQGASAQARRGQGAPRGQERQQGQQEEINEPCLVRLCPLHPFDRSSLCLVDTPPIVLSRRSLSPPLQHSLCAVRYLTPSTQSHDPSHPVDCCCYFRCWESSRAVDGIHRSQCASGDMSLEHTRRGASSVSHGVARGQRRRHECTVVYFRKCAASPTVRMGSSGTMQTMRIKFNCRMVQFRS